MTGLPIIGLVVMLAPFAAPTDHVRPSAPDDSVTVGVHVHGLPREHVRLRAVDLPPGYIASFCTPRLCAPFAVAFDLPAGGHAVIELQLIENVAGSRKPARIVVLVNGMTRSAIDYSRAIR
jgi:hypothetical protein